MKTKPQLVYQNLILRCRATVFDAHAIFVRAVPEILCSVNRPLFMAVDEIILYKTEITKKCSYQDLTAFQKFFL